MNLAGMPSSTPAGNSRILEAPHKNIGVREKVDAALSMLRAQGHTVRSCATRDGWAWFEIDGVWLASWFEMQGLADGSCTLTEIEQLF